MSAHRSPRAARALLAAGGALLVVLLTVAVLADGIVLRVMAAVGALGLVGCVERRCAAADARRRESAERTADFELLLSVSDLPENADDAELIAIAANALAARLGLTDARGRCLPLPADSAADDPAHALAVSAVETGRPTHDHDQLAVPVLVDEDPVAVLAFRGHEDVGADARVLRLCERVAAQLGRRLERRRALSEIAAARDQAQAATHAQGAFLATMSHEMRTPLNGVLGMATVLRGTDLDEAQAECVTTLESSARGLLDQINDMLDYVRLESDDVCAECEPYEPGTLVEDVAAAHATAAQARGLELVIDVCDDVPERVLGDESRVRQVVDQLLRNAVAYTRKGMVMARLAVWQGGDGPVLRFEVADTGCGLSPEAQSTLFESFRQGDGSFSRTHGGMGLGLALSRRVARLLGGGLGVESVEGRGSTFWLDVPGPETAADGDQPPRPQSDVQGLAVLVVDDNPQARRVTCERLVASGARVEARDAREGALECLRAAAASGAPFDVVVIDHELGDDVGAELGLAIRTDARLAHTALVLTEVGARRADDALCAQVGFTERLLRPLRASRVCAAVAHAAAARKPAPGAVKTRPPADAPAEDEAGSGRAARILLAEDNPVNQAVARRLLQRLGHRVDLAKNGREAVEAAGRVGYDLVLMDCQMPEMDGFDATRAIRALPGRAGKLPIVALTANALIGDRQRCLDAGMDDYLAKPIDAEALGRTVANWLELGVSARVSDGADEPAVPG